jgi:hypothetical protein
MLRRDQHVEQRHQIEYFAAIDQLGFFADLRGNVQRAQLVLQRQQAGAFARQHHHVLRPQPACDLPGNPRGGLARFARAQGFFGQFARRGQAVAPAGGQRRSFLFVLVAGNRRQAAHGAGQARGRGVFAKAVITVGLARRGHGGVDGVYDRLGVAPRMVAAEQIAAQAVHHKGLRGAEHLRLGAAKAVNALFGVAHQKHAGRRARARVTDEPGIQRLPLQRVGVLELVDHQVAYARVQPLLHPAREDGVGQHQQRGALDVVHVDPAAFAL